MKLRAFLTLALLGAAPLACGDDGGDTDSDSADPTGDPGTDPTDGANDGPICAHFGGYAGIGELIDNFVGKVLVDERINAYFLTTDVDGGNLGTCLKKQVGQATGCSGITYDCGDMKTVHTGMGISMLDFGDLAQDFSLAMDEQQGKYPDVTDEDKMTVLGVLGDMAPDIVEDAANANTVYQRLGRKPGIATVIGDGSDPMAFIGVVVADASINGFFGATDVPRLRTCLVRQVTSATGGPNIYGKEVDAPMPADPGAGAANPCLDMVTSHASLLDANDGKGIEFADFGALVGDLVTAMTNFGVPQAEQDAIAAALGPLCSMIVTVDPEMCG